jgi:type II restriction/modification system DNA methylase subunit YeeA
MSTLTPFDFVNKWRNSELKERSSAQENFIDLCRLMEHPTPAEVDSTGQSFTFEAGVGKVGGGQGFADVWKKGSFAWEYKGNHKDLDKAYQQLLQYREALQNPPLLIVSDLEQIIIHTNFTNTVKSVVRLTLDDLVTSEGQEHLRAIFYEPERFRVETTTEQVTMAAAREFARLADLLRARGEEPYRAAHFLIRLLFCLFAEDTGLLPRGLFTKLVSNGRRNPAMFVGQLGQLFGAMTAGGWFGEHSIRHFNGGLFNDAEVLPLDFDALTILESVGAIDWSSIEPSIFGTLFERSLDPSKRSQLGAHYTSREDILLVVEPVVMAPLRRQWEAIRAQADELVKRRDSEKSERTKDNRQKELRELFLRFADELSKVRLLDPACGSGNFLYVALRQLLDLEKEVITYAGSVGVGTFFPSVSPSQLHGIEINEYAHELAQATIWIGYIQWLQENGFGVPSEPILKPLNTILNMDAILVYDDNGNPAEPEWPEADVIVGNPPFLGDKRMKRELGDDFVNSLRKLYSDSVPGGADLVTYWFERARRLIHSGKVKRAGLLATDSIRTGANRRVLDSIKESGDIFFAWRERPWLQDGAAVQVSMIGFDAGTEQVRIFNGQQVPSINADLTAGVDVTTAKKLQENEGICFLGVMKGGPFDIDDELATSMLATSNNPNGRPNHDVVKRRMNGQDVVGRNRGGWIIDFVDMPLEEAAEYEVPFEYVRKVVKPIRDSSRDSRMKTLWWLHGRSRPALRQKLQGLSRYIITPEVSKHRVFDWMPTTTIPDHRLHVFARDDDYFFGVLHSKPHEVWALKTGSRLEDRPCYTASATFEPFPFPWPPSKELPEDSRVQAIALAARDMLEKRNRWLNPEGATEAESKKRTLTNLYNDRPTWLDLAHKKLDNAVLDAYGWPYDLKDVDIVSRLLLLNLERAENQVEK